MRVSAGFATLCLATALLLSGCTQPAAPETAPDIVFTLTDGQRPALRDLRGQPVLIRFWSVDCPTCRRERPELARLYRDYQPRGVALIAQAMPYDRPDLVLREMQNAGMTYPVSLDIDGKILNSFKNIPGTPTTLLIGRDGTIVFRRAGRTPFDELRHRLDRALAGSAAG